MHAADAAAIDGLGGAVAYSGDTLVAGALGDDDLGTDSGSAYVFTRAGGVWTQQAKLLAADGQAGDYFGQACVIDGDLAWIAAPLDDDLGSESGSVYVFRRTGTNWNQVAKLLAFDGQSFDRYGESLALDASRLLVSSRQPLHGHTAGYLYSAVAPGWPFEAKLIAQPPQGSVAPGFGGVAVALHGTRAVLGVPSWSFPALTGPGAAFVFEQQSGQWGQTAMVTRDALVMGTSLGASVAIEGSRVVIGLPGESGASCGWCQGAVNTYQLVPAPEIYCTAKQNSLGCIPEIDWRGLPSGSALAGFEVLCTQVRNRQAGLLFYGTGGRQGAPFQGGLLCLAGALRRAPAQNSQGSAAPAQDCSGVHSLDWSGFAAGALGGSPLPAVRLPGTRVQVQWWGRDPGFTAPFDTMLSDALEFTVAP